MLLTRRRLLRAALGLAAVAATGGATAAYAVVLEPRYRLLVREYRLSLPGWADRPPMTLCALADPHCCEPWLPLDRLRRIVRLANALEPDLQLVLGDLPAHHRFVGRRLPMGAVAEALGELRAPLGRFAVLGNHDWWDDDAVQRAGRGRPAIEGQLEAAGLRVLSNRAARLPHGDGVWLCGTDSMGAWLHGRPAEDGGAYHAEDGGPRRGADDLARALAPLGADAAPAILMAHEPDQFPAVPARVALTLSGHTHGGQVRLAGYSPMVPSRHGNRYAYGLVREGGRQLVVSGGLGCSIMPVRLGVPPELTLIHLS